VFRIKPLSATAQQETSLLDLAKLDKKHLTLNALGSQNKCNGILLGFHEIPVQELPAPDLRALQELSRLAGES
jgi:hypothetical protein